MDTIAACTFLTPSQQSPHQSTAITGSKEDTALKSWKCDDNRSQWSDNLLTERHPSSPDFMHVVRREASCLSFCWAPSWEEEPAHLDHGIRLAELQGSHRTSQTRDTYSLRMAGSDALSWETFSILCDKGPINEAIQTLHYMEEEGINVSTDTYFQLLLRCMDEEDPSMGRKLHGLIVRRGLESNEFLASELIRMFMLFGSLSEAHQVFIKLPKPALFSWSAIIRANAKLGQNEQGMKLFSQLQKLDVGLDEQVFVSVLKVCSNIAALEYGVNIHALVIECGLEYGKYVGCTLIDMYIKCSSLEDAHVMFDRLPKENAVTWNALIAGYGEHGCSEQALQLFYRMQKEGIEPHRVTFICTLKACSDVAAYDHGRQIHANIIEFGLEWGAFVGNTLINMYGRCGNLADAKWVFDRLPKQNTVAWNALITGYVQHGSGEEALQMFQQMQYERVEPDQVTFVCVLKACSEIAALEHGREVHTQVIDSSFALDGSVNNTLVDMYANCGSLQDARSVFDRMSNRDVVTWSALIAGYAEHGHEQEALQLLKKMQEERIHPNAVTFISILKACSSIVVDVVQSKLIHSLIVGSGFELDSLVSHALVYMYIKRKSIEDARVVFQRLPERDVVAWTMLIEGCIQLDCGQEAVRRLFEDMHEEGVEPDPILFTCALKACSDRAALEQGRQIHTHIVHLDFKLDVYIGSALMDLYAKCEQLEEARMVFNKLPTQNVVTWNTLMAGYMHHGHGIETFQIYQGMQQEGMKPDPVTCLCVLKACSSIAALEHGRQIHAYIIENQFELDIFVGSTLVDMYAKCGSLEDACTIFNRLPKQTVVSWNALIAGCAQRSNYPLAFQLFEDMQQQTGSELNAVTFVCLLSACSHGGSLHEGFSHFKSMREDHRITPMVEHYNLLVDLLGRKGYLSEAEDLLETVPFQSNIVGWTSLLSSCKLHVNVDLGRRCFDRFIMLDKRNAAGYVLLSSVYVNAGLWQEARKVEELRIQASCWKKPATAFIEIENRVHNFTVGDACHPRSPSIYAKLLSLNTEMRKEGYNDRALLALDSFSDEPKEADLCGHCEKLAIAFGLICTPQGTTIRVSKNLRMCTDCHNTSKMISKIEMREIIVSDTYCIHHFQKGECSCKT